MTDEAKVDIYSPICTSTYTFPTLIFTQQDFCVKTGVTYKYILHLVQINERKYFIV